MKEQALGGTAGRTHSGLGEEVEDRSVELHGLTAAPITPFPCVTQRSGRRRKEIEGRCLQFPFSTQLSAALIGNEINAFREDLVLAVTVIGERFSCLYISQVILSYFLIFLPPRHSVTFSSKHTFPLLFTIHVLL